jgi:ribonuclease HI
MNNIIIHCDGGCRGNQFDENIGAWAVVLKYKNNIKELTGTAKNTTNNIMEIQSCIEGLKAIKNKNIPVEVIMDSQYVIIGINKWIDGWIKRGWRKSDKKSVENKELWKELYELKNTFVDITFSKCSGHANNEGNNRVDELVNEAMDKLG